MKVNAIRFCSVSAHAPELARFLGEGLGLPPLEGGPSSGDEFTGAVFPAGDSWIEVWPEGPGMPAGIMLQIVVDDADAWAERARANGLKPQDFYELVLDENAAEFVFVGELRHLKGVDIFLRALAELRKKRPVTAYIAGGGPQTAKFQALARKLKLVDAVTFAGPTPAGAAFTRGRCLIVPSRAELSTPSVTKPFGTRLKKRYDQP